MREYITKLRSLAFEYHQMYLDLPLRQQRIIIITIVSIYLILLLSLLLFTIKKIRSPKGSNNILEGTYDENYDKLAEEQIRSTKKIKELEIYCDMNGQRAPFKFYLGYPAKSSHPINFQSVWLQKNQGGMVPANMMSSLTELQKIATANNAEFINLAKHAIDEANKQLRDQKN